MQIPPVGWNNNEGNHFLATRFTNTFSQCECLLYLWAQRGQTVNLETLPNKGGHIWFGTAITEQCVCMYHRCVALIVCVCIVQSRSRL